MSKSESRSLRCNLIQIHTKKDSPSFLTLLLHPRRYLDLSPLPILSWKAISEPDALPTPSILAHILHTDILEPKLPFAPFPRHHFRYPPLLLRSSFLFLSLPLLILDSLLLPNRRLGFLAADTLAFQQL